MPEPVNGKTRINGTFASILRMFLKYWLPIALATGAIIFKYGLLQADVKHNCNRIEKLEEKTVSVDRFDDLKEELKEIKHEIRLLRINMKRAQ